MSAERTTYPEAVARAQAILGSLGRNVTAEEAKFELALGLGKLSRIEKGIQKAKSRIYLNALSNSANIKRMADKLSEL